MEVLDSDPLWLVPPDENRLAAVPERRIIGPCVIMHRKIIRTNEMCEGAINVLLSAPMGAVAQLEHREGIKFHFFIPRVIEELQQQTEQAPPAGGEDEEAGPPPPSGDPPLLSTVLVPVCNGAADVVDLLQENAAEPDVVDYRGVVALALYLVTRDDSSGALRRAVESILAKNNLRVDGPGKRGDGDGKRGPAGAPDRKALKRSIEAMNGTTHHAMEAACAFHTRPSPPGGRGATEDWSLCLQTPLDLTVMLAALCPGFSPPPRDAPHEAHLDAFVRALTGTAGNNHHPSFYGLHEHAQLPLRTMALSDMGFGVAGPGLCALEVAGRGQAWDFRRRQSVKSTRLPLLRAPSLDPERAAEERSRETFLSENPPMFDNNREGALGRLKLHASRFISSHEYDLTLLARERSIVARADAANPRSLGKPELQHVVPRRSVAPWPTPMSDSDDEPEDDERSKMWRATSPGCWDLRHAYDTALGPIKERTGTAKTYPSMRLLKMHTLRAPASDGRLVPVAAALLVQKYEAKKPLRLEADCDGHVVVPSSFVDVSGSSRTPSVLLARTDAALDGESGPVWPSRSRWMAGPSDIWMPTTRLLWRVGSKLHHLVALRMRPDGLDVISREAHPPSWVTVRVQDDVVRVPAPAQLRLRLMRRLEAAFVETLRCTQLLPASMRMALDWWGKHQAKLRAGARAAVPRGYVYSNLCPQMNFVAMFYDTLEFTYDVHLYHSVILRVYMAHRHVAKTADTNVKMPHMILFGPGGVGKSFVCELCAEMSPPGIAESLTHATAQRNFGDFEHCDEITCRVEARDEADGGQMGMGGESSNGRAQNSMSSRSTEHKEMCTKQRIKAISLERDASNKRVRRTYEVANEVVNIQNMNNYPDLPLPMLTRYLIACCYKLRRKDMASVLRRAMSAERKLDKASS